jgi:hypothetical protein
MHHIECIHPKKRTKFGSEEPDMSVEKNQDSPEMARFNDALRQAMQVSKVDLKRLLAEDKITPLVPQKRGRKPKLVASDPVFRDKD